jgi:hypothetical protein
VICLFSSVSLNIFLPATHHLVPQALKASSSRGMYLTVCAMFLWPR